MPWSNENKSCMRVEKQELAYESFFNSHAPVKPEQELMRSEKRGFAWEFCNSHAPVKQEQELTRVGKRVCMRVFSTPKPRSNENKSCMRVDWISGMRARIAILIRVSPMRNTTNDRYMWRVKAVVNLKPSGSDHKRSHMGPSWGTSCLRSIERICSENGQKHVNKYFGPNTDCRISTLIAYNADTVS
jgi:hypothetical protein